MNDNVKYQCQLFVHSTMILIIIYILNTYLKGINKKLFTTGAQFRSSMLKTNNLFLSWANPTFLLPVLKYGWGLAGRAGWITEYCCVSCAPPLIQSSHTCQPGELAPEHRYPTIWESPERGEVTQGCDWLTVQAGLRSNHSMKQVDASPPRDFTNPKLPFDCQCHIEYLHSPRMWIMFNIP